MKRLFLAAILGLALLFCAWLLIANSSDNRQWKLTEAAGSGDLATVRRLFSEGANLNAVPMKEGGAISGSPALLEAIENGHDDVVQFFIDHNADLEISCSDISSPLEIAIGKRNYVIAEQLLSHGASVNHAINHVLRPEDWNPPLEPRMFDLLRQYGAITTTTFRKVPPTLFFCTSRRVHEEDVTKTLQESVPAIYSAASLSSVALIGSLHVNYSGRNLRHPGSFLLELAIPAFDVQYPIPDGYYYKTATDFKCLAAQTNGSRKNIEYGWHLLEGLLWKNIDAYPTYEMREVYQKWRSADSKENIVELQLGIHHPVRDAQGNQYEAGDSFHYIDSDFQ